MFVLHTINDSQTHNGAQLHRSVFLGSTNLNVLLITFEGSKKVVRDVYLRKLMLFHAFGWYVSLYKYTSVTNVQKHLY